MKQILAKIPWIIVYSLLGLFLYNYFSLVISNLGFMSPCNHIEGGVLNYLFCVFLPPLVGLWITAISSIGPFLCIFGFIMGFIGIYHSIVGLTKDLLGKSTPSEEMGFIVAFSITITCFGILYVSYNGFIDSWLYELMMEYT